MSEPTEQPAEALPVADFDEQRWPINLAILALAGFVVGVLVTTTHDFNDPRILFNGWVRLASVVLLIGLLFWGANALQGKMRRRIQLCVLLSLLVHAGLAIYLHDRYLVALAEREQRLALQATENRESYTVPDYHWTNAQQAAVQEEFEKPVATKLPEHEQPAMRPSPVEMPSPVVKPESAEPETPQPRPQVAEIQRAELSAPRREDQVGGLAISRQPSQVRLQANEQIPRPSIRPVREQPPALQPVAPTSRRQAALPETRVPQAAPPVEPATIAPSLARQAWSETLPVPAREAPIVPTRQATAATVPAVAEEAPQVVAAVAEQPVDLRSPDAAVQREADTVVPATFVDEPEFSSSVVPAGGVVDEPRRLEEMPSAVPLPPASLARTASHSTPGELVAPTTDRPTAKPLPGAAADSSTLLQPQTTTVARATVPTTTTNVGGTSLAITATGLPQAEPPLVKPRELAAGDEQPPLRAHAGEAPPLRRIAAPGALSGEAETSEPGPVAHATTDDSSAEPAIPAEVGGPSRREGGLPVLIAAVDGPGGIDSDRAPLVGIPSRRSRPESEIVHAIPQRFILQRSGGPRTLEGKILEPPAAAFRQRQPGLRSQVAKERGGSEGTERAVELGLSFLARNQFPDGRWCLDRIPNSEDAEPSFFAGEMNCDTAATGLSLLAFLGAGYTHREDKHQDTVHRGLQWLIRNQQPNGQLFTRETDATQPARIYGHGIATIALCEAYGMTRDPGLREPAEKAIRYILDAQDPRHGGWRYTQPDDTPVWYRESDTSVSGWMVMALKSAQMAGLQVPEEPLHRVSRWLDGAQAQGGSLYVYNPHAMLTPEQIRGRSPNRAMTAEGLLMRLYLGWQRDNPALVAGAEYLRTNLPALGTTEQPLRDSYYWYYATQVMFQMQGDCWTTWNDQLQAMLEPSQVMSGPLAGSWHPRYPQSDRWAHAGGRLYVTALNLLMLEVYYRHLPLFRMNGG